MRLSLSPKNLPTCELCGGHYRLGLDDHQETQLCAARQGALVLDHVARRQKLQGRSRVFKQYLPFLKRLGIPWVEDYVKVEVQPAPEPRADGKRAWKFWLVKGYYANSFVVGVAHNSTSAFNIGAREHLLRRAQDDGLEALEARWRLEGQKKPILDFLVKATLP